MPGGRQGGRHVPVLAGDDVVAHQHAAGPGVHTGLEGQKVLLQEGVVGAVIHGDARMGVGVVAVAREVLEHAAHAAFLIDPHHLGDHPRGGLGVQAQGAVVHKGPGLPGDVAHRGEVHVDAQVLQGVDLILLHAGDKPRAPGVVQVPGRPVGLVADVGIGGGPHHGAPLLVHPDEQGDLGGGLPPSDVLPDLLGSKTLKVPAEEDVAPKLVLAHILQGALRRDSNEKQLPNFLFQGHGRKKLLRRGAGGLGLGLRGGLLAGLPGKDNGDGRHAQAGLGGGVVGDRRPVPLQETVPGGLGGVGEDYHQVRAVLHHQVEGVFRGLLHGALHGGGLRLRGALLPGSGPLPLGSGELQGDGGDAQARLGGGVVGGHGVAALQQGVAGDFRGVGNDHHQVRAVFHGELEGVFRGLLHGALHGGQLRLFRGGGGGGFASAFLRLGGLGGLGRRLGGALPGLLLAAAVEHPGAQQQAQRQGKYLSFHVMSHPYLFVAPS